jgi:hypothetical protein
MLEITKESAEKDLKKLVEDRKQVVKKPGTPDPNDLDAAAQKAVQDAEKKRQAEEKKKADAEAAQAQAKEDERILAVEDESTLNEADKARKAEIVKKQRESETPEQKKERERQEKIDKRFAELSAKMTAELNELKKDKEANKIKIAQLEKEKEELAQKVNPQHEQKSVDDKVQERVSKYLEEDKEKPREQRREMTKEELDEWFAEDFAAANVWVTERTYRRAEERKDVVREAQIEGITKKQSESYQRVLAEDPEMEVEKASERGQALKKEGKTDAEIADIIKKEFPKVALSYEVIQEHPDWTRLPNAPERVAAEVKSRLNKAPSKDPELEQLKADLAEARKRIEELEGKEEEENKDIGISSNTRQVGDKNVKLTEQENLLIKTMKSRNASQDRIDSALKKLRAKRNA